MPRIALSGRLICADDAQAGVLERHLNAHIRASRAEPGCLRFEITPTEDALIWRVDELFADQAAFDAHKARTAASPWAEATKEIRRDISLRTADE
jgi:quinol monooxygenase YgiN